MSRPDYDGPMDEVLSKAADHEFGFDPEQQAVLEIRRDGGYKDASDLVAQSVVALVKSGVGLGEAALATGQTLESLRNNTKARTALRRLKADWELDAEELKQLVKTTAVQLAIEGEDKQKLDALKLIAQMPDVGLAGTSSKLNVAVGVFSDETTKVLASIHPNEEG